MSTLPSPTLIKRKFKRKPDPGYPLLRGVLIPDPRGDTVECWCPHCQRSHIHGWPKGTHRLDVSHRCAHCEPGTPFKDKGYFIGLLPQVQTTRKPYRQP